MVTAFNWTSGGDVSGTWTINGVTFTFGQGEGTTNLPKYYSTGGGAIRLYHYNTMSISAGTAILKITIAVAGSTTYRFVANDNTQGTITYDENSVTTAIFDFGNGV